MARKGWKQLLAGTSWYCRSKRFPILAYSEFMPPPRLGRKPYGSHDPTLFKPSDPFGWNVTEYEETMELRPGLQFLATQLVHVVEHLGLGRPAHGISRPKLEGNPYWPEELAVHAGRLPHERYVVIAPLALSRTQDDKGRVRWTLFGGSEHGPATAFWKGFFTEPGQEMATDAALGFFRRLLATAYGDCRPSNCTICTRPAFASCRDWTTPRCPTRNEDLPSWTERYLLADGARLSRVRYLLTFRPFGSLPQGGPPGVPGRRARTCCRFPAAWCSGASRRFCGCGANLPLAMQIPLLNVFDRHEDPYGHARAAVGLDARAAPRSPRAGPRRAAAPQHLPAHPSLGANPSARGRTGRDRRRGPHRPRALQHAAGRRRPLRQADGPQRPNLDARLPAAAGRSAGRREGDRAGRGRRCERADSSAIGSSFRRCESAGTRSTGIARWWRVSALAASEPEVVPHAPLGYMTAYAAAKPEPGQGDRVVAAHPGRGSRTPQSLCGFSATPGHHEHRVSIDNARKVLEACELWGARSVAGRLRPIAVDHSPRQNARRLAATHRPARPTRQRRKPTGRGTAAARSLRLADGGGG